MGVGRLLLERDGAASKSHLIQNVMDLWDQRSAYRS